jgi:hypothetical protein
MGPYLAERQWGTVREDYSQMAAWDYINHDKSTCSNAYRWGVKKELRFCDSAKYYV